jgi:hypothetical protein
MRIASHCQNRALLLLQVAQECPQFKEQADYLAHEWLVLAAMRIDLAGSGKPKKRFALREPAVFESDPFCADSLFNASVRAADARPQSLVPFLAAATPRIARPAREDKR